MSTVATTTGTQEVSKNGTSSQSAIVSKSGTVLTLMTKPGRTAVKAIVGPGGGLNSGPRDSGEIHENCRHSR